MTQALLLTKLFVPPPRPNLVLRPRLLQKLQNGRYAKLILIAAPAGFGKTTLAANWLADLRLTIDDLRLFSAPNRQSKIENRKSSWLSLDEADNEPNRFAQYLIAALRQVDESLGTSANALLQSPQPTPLIAVMAALLNEITAVSTPSTLVLDDYHLIHNEVIHGALAFLLEQASPNFQLLITSRSTPPLPLSRWRGRGQLVEIKTADLRFTLDEAQSFFSQTMALQLSDEAVAALEARTEGWVTGLQLAAVSLQQHHNQADFIAAFSGRHQYVFDYLVDEVMNQQPAHIRQFLLQTAVLDRFCVELCDAVLEIGDWRLEIEVPSLQSPVSSLHILNHLNRSNLFLIALDDERRWYRYHHLFAELLQARLRQQASEDDIRVLHQRAAVWLQQHHHTDEAIRHALAAQAFDLAADLITETADAQWTRGATTTLQTWLAQLPQSVMETNPRAAIYYAWTIFFAAQLQSGGEATFQQAAQLLATAVSHMPPHDPNWGILYAARAALASLQRDVPTVLEDGHQALTHLPEDAHIWRSVVNITMAFTYRVMGDVAVAIDLFGEAARMSDRGGNLFGALFAYSNWAALLVEQAQLPAAMQTYQEALAMIARDKVEGLPITGQIYAGWGHLLLEQNRLQEAAEALATAVVWSRANGFPVAADGFALARVYWLLGDEAKMATAVQNATENLQTLTDAPQHLTAAKLAQLHLWWLMGDETAVSQWAKTSGFSLDDDPDFRHVAEYLWLVRVSILAGEAEAVLPLLQKLAGMVNGRNGSLITIHSLRAIAHHALNQTAAAQSALHEALTLAEPNGYMRTFVDEGEWIRPLLIALYQDMKQSDDGLLPYVEQLLLVMRGEETADTIPDQPLVEPLSERELQILNLIVAGHSNQEIAAELVVAVSTIKWHINNIYGKLNVRRRAQAIAKAQELSLV